MRRSRGCDWVETLVEHCGDLHASGGVGLGVPPVIELWVFGDLLEPPAAPDWVYVALVIDAPPDEVPWLTVPSWVAPYVQLWRLDRIPVARRWRSASRPVWNHAIVRPLRVWSASDGAAHNALAALRDGDVEPLRLRAPSGVELVEQLRVELATSRHALERAVSAYEDERTRLGVRADRLYATASGFLDLMHALDPAGARG